MVDVFVFFSDGSGAIGSRVGLRIRRCAGTSQSAGPFWVLALTHIAVYFRTSDDLVFFGHIWSCFKRQRFHEISRVGKAKRDDA